jgi:hypothetical protein
VIDPDNGAPVASRLRILAETILHAIRGAGNVHADAARRAEPSPKGNAMSNALVGIHDVSLPSTSAIGILPAVGVVVAFAGSCTTFKLEFNDANPDPAAFCAMNESMAACVFEPILLRLV